MNENPNNPFGIPDLTPMLEKVTAYVKEHQGEKGFINTDNMDCDTIWGLIYDERLNEGVEVQVKAVRVNEHGILEAMVDYDPNTIYTDDGITESEKLNHNTSVYGTFLDVRNDDYLYFIHTIFNIAENIREYVTGN